MAGEVEIMERIEVVYAAEGHERHSGVHVKPEITVAEFAVIVAKDGGFTEAVEVFLEEGEEPLGGDLKLVECLSAEFAPLHIATHGHIAVTVRYGGKEIEHPFRPSATVAKVTKWAAGPHGFKLEGEPCDFQLKHNGNVLPPDTHIGQVAHHKKVTCDLVFKVKPQG